ncbi:large subunit ribosomal protein L34e [Strigomonas culicis]|uniref:Large subunit ribosomal protein L34e n=1 Tax=Strigomonas culicis TaxID=28005 RepID=S9WAZ9_9TRYP|nr:large subunit ribosomal protein L34e [Strigomonas culicis]|eukprot:EPY33140.1 large subunit ribosomal protein L34e [Strigomonas culicis]
MHQKHIIGLLLLGRELGADGGAGRVGLLGSRLLGERLASDALRNGLLRALFLLALVERAAAQAVGALAGGESLLHDALLLDEEGADDAVADLVVAQHAAVGARHRLRVARGQARVDVAQRLGAAEALVAQHPRRVDALGALRALLQHEAVAGGAHHLHAVAARRIVHAAAVRNTLAAHVCGTRDNNLEKNYYASASLY